MDKYFEERCNNVVEIELGNIENAIIFRNFTEMERCDENYRDFCRIGYGKTESGINEYSSKSYWKLLSNIKELKQFLISSNDFNEIMDITINDDTYHFCYIEMIDDCIRIHYNH